MVVKSSDADAISFPSGEKNKALTWPQWPISVMRVAAVVEPQSLVVLSLYPDAIISLSVDRATADINLQTRGVRVLARKLTCVDPLTFGLLKCRGEVQGIKRDGRRPSSFDFVFQIPEEVSSEPRSFQSCLMTNDDLSLIFRLKLAKQLSKSISYAHTLGFLHKNVRPETVLVFVVNESVLGLSFLIRLEQTRMAEAPTLQRGDSAWEKNLYRHPKH
ncbi:MAG: hypothetical protein M1829_003787 [Trizodia sp. TS-e1964]|nr:MAG: hypothetical protein M1829_003787 [Trizodia sp. TS-e1964]